MRPLRLRDQSITIRLEISINRDNSTTAHTYTPHVSLASLSLAGTEAAPILTQGSVSTNSVEHQHREEQRLVLWQSHLTSTLGQDKHNTDRQVRTVLRVMKQLKVSRFEDITTAMLLDWLLPRVNVDRPGARRTAANNISTLRMYGDYLVLRRDIQSNPTQGVRVAQLRNKKRRSYKPFTREQIDQLIASARQREQKNWQARRAMASVFYELLYETTLRFNELRTQEVGDINLSQGTILVTHDKARRNDSLPLSKRAIALITQWLKSEDRAKALAAVAHGDGGNSSGGGDGGNGGKQTRLFPLVPSHNSLAMDMRACGIAAVSDGGERGQWHRFRKAGLTHRAKAGASVRDLYHFARHSDPKTTLELYDFAEAEELREVAEFRPKGGDGGPSNENSPKKAFDFSPKSRENVAGQQSRHTGTTISRVDDDARAQTRVTADPLNCPRPGVLDGSARSERGVSSGESEQSGAGGN